MIPQHLTLQLLGFPLTALHASLGCVVLEELVPLYDLWEEVA